MGHRIAHACRQYRASRNESVPSSRPGPASLVQSRTSYAHSGAGHGISNAYPSMSLRLSWSKSQT
eukprot:710154-Rhodomonas_salina.1